jgi:hypothetical protein
VWENLDVVSEMKVCRGVLKTENYREEFELAFEDAEVVALNTYVIDVEKLLQRSFLHSAENFHLSFKFSVLQTPQASSSVETGEFAEEHWAAFLHLFRPLAGLNNDKQLYGFQRVRRLIERRAVPNLKLCVYLKDLLHQFQLMHLPLTMTFGIGNKRYDLEGAFDIWMNAMEFHRDPAKRAIIDQINAILPADGMRTLMANLAIEKLQAMDRLRQLIVLFLLPPGAELSLVTSG